MNTYNNNTTERGAVRPVGGPSYGESPASGPAPTTAGHHRHDILNKLDPRVDSTKDNRPIATSNSNGVPEGTYGPHSSRLANALDPRVDSDADRSRAAPGGGGMMHGGAGGDGMGMATGVGRHHNNNNNAYNNNGVSEGTYGPHSSRLANALDPRVDSDADRNRAGPGGGGGTAGMMHGGAGGGGATHQQQHGMFSSTGHGGAGGGGLQNNTVASGASGLPGPAPKTARPHKSDLLNKLDPRVDSKTGAVSGTYGGGTTGTQGNTGAAGMSGRYM